MPKKYILTFILCAAAAVAIVYIIVSFYKIEHTHSYDNRLLLTRQTQLRNNLDKYNESFESAMNQILECHDKDNGRLYNLSELPSNDALSVIMNECNVSLVMINGDVDEITFYQTALPDNDEVTLSYVGRLENNGETAWDITKSFPDFSRKETMGVKIYNFVFNRGII